jgi:ABC-2 type transport system permease protein
MLTLLQAELKRSWNIFKAYPVDEVLGAVIMAALFLICFFSAKFMAGPTANFGTRGDATVVGYIVWMLSMAKMSDTSSSLRSEASTGTLEQLMTSPFGAVRIFLIRSLADTTVIVAWMAVVSALIILVTHPVLHFSFSVIVPILTVLATATGLGLMLSSLVLLFKRMDSIGQIVNFLLLGLLVLPLESWAGPRFWLGSLLPITPGSSLLREILVKQQFDFTLLAISLINGVAYFSVGAFLFTKALARAKRRGLVGKY